MSLFDVIKCRIDENYLLEDLRRIPQQILCDWCREELGTDSMLSAPTWIHEHMKLTAHYYNGGMFQAHYRRRYLDSLRKRIREYEEPLKQMDEDESK